MSACICPYCALRQIAVPSIDINVNEGWVICPLCGSTHVHALESEEN
jgi:transcription elongation factor Elf1